MCLRTVDFLTVAGSMNSAKALSDMLGDGRSELAGSLNSFWAVFFTNDGISAVHFSPCEIQPFGRPGLLMLSLIYKQFLGYKKMFDIFPRHHQWSIRQFIIKPYSKCGILRIPKLVK